MLQGLILGILRFYQKTLSFDHGLLGKVTGVRICRFHPTCSSYMIEAIRKYGTLRGAVLGVKRLASCHPWNDGGYDPVP